MLSFVGPDTAPRRSVPGPRTTPPFRALPSSAAIPAVLARLGAFEARVAERASTFLGYPESMAFDYGPVMPLLRFNLDNLGDPYSDLLYGVNSTELEREVLAWFAELYDLDPEDSWGYVTSSGSEGNLYGLYLGREACPDAVLYYSAATHYSVSKAARLLRLPSEVVPVLSDGRLDLDGLECAVRRHPGRPAIVNANLGTTMTGAVDDVPGVLDVLARAGVPAHYVHCDAALSGVVLPFLQDAPRITFDDAIGSVSVSGHKFLGAPYPCGVVVARREHVSRIQSAIPYIGALDATIGGSRNGQAPVYLWYALQTRGTDDGFHREVETCRDNARSLYWRLADLGTAPLLNDHSLTVVFDEPSEHLVRRWSLARQAGRAHVVTVPHATPAMLEQFLAEMERELSPETEPALRVTP
jgi:histidine decarboxylase